MKNILSVLSSLFVIAVLTFSSFSISAGSDSHLKEAIQHTEAAAQASDAKAVAQHAEEAKRHANAAKTEKPGNQHIQAGLKSLDDTTRQAHDDKTDEAKKAAEDALKHFKEVEK